MVIKFLLVALFSLTAEAAIESPKSVVEEIFAKASDALIVNDTSKQAAINQMVDFESLAKGALGKLVKKSPAKDVTWFQKTLQEIITATVYPNAPEFLKGVKISYDEVLERGLQATVKSTVQNKADLTEVHYVLQKGKDGAWRVVDISLDGNSWVESIRDQVEETVKKKGWKGLKEAMEKRLKDLKSKG